MTIIQDRRRVLLGLLGTAAAVAIRPGAAFANGFALDPRRGVYSLAAILDPIMPSVAQVLVERREIDHGGGPEPRLDDDPDADDRSRDNRSREARPRDDRPRDDDRAPAPDPATAVRRSSGSAVVIDAAKGLLLTNHHVVDRAARVRVVFSDGREAEAEVVGSDQPTDIAVLRTALRGLVAMPIAADAGPSVGDLVMAIGYPFGLQQTVTQGIVSGLGRTLGRSFTDFIQTDAAINSGNSGGALVDSAGRLIGINTAIYSRSGGNVGIGYAAPVSIAKAVMAQILDYGEVRRGRLGVDAKDLDAELAAALGVADAKGAVIIKIQPGSPGEAAGLKLRDVVVETAGQPVRTTVEFRNAVGLARPDQPLRLVVLRGSERVGLTVQLEAVAGAATGQARWGARFAALDPRSPIAQHVRGVVVERIEPGGAAAREGLRAGDVVTAINQKPVRDLAALTGLLQAMDRGVAALTVVRGNSELIIVLRDA